MPAHSSSIRVGEHKIAFRHNARHPSNGAIVLIHGAGCSSQDWPLSWLDGREAAFGDLAVYALDLPEHGASGGYALDDIPAMAALVTGFIKALALTEVCLVGHSMGAIFLAKYLSETQFPVSIKATILIASPFSDESVEDLTDFKIESLSGKLVEQAGGLVFFNGNDDPVISKADIDQYRKALADAEFITLPAPDHFVRQDFPQLVKKIQDIQAAS